MKEFGDWLSDLTKELQDNTSINKSQPKNPPAGELQEDADEWEDYYQRAMKASRMDNIRGRANPRPGGHYYDGREHNGED